MSKQDLCQNCNDPKPPIEPTRYNTRLIFGGEELSELELIDKNILCDVCYELEHA